MVFDPTNTKCSKFNDFLNLLDSDDQDVLKKHAALCLTGDNPLQRILILDGLAKTGKTTYVNVVAKLLGPGKATPLRTKYLNDRFEVGQLKGKSLLIGPDVDANFLELEGASILKALCGHDTLKGELKCGNETFDVAGRFNIMIAANTRLKIRLQGDHEAWERRLIIIRFEKTYSTEKRIFDLDDVLIKDEGSAILNWALSGIALLKKDLDQAKDIRLSAKQQKRVNSLVKESEALRNFLKSEVCTRSGSNLSVDELVTAFTAYCQDKDRNWTVDSVRNVQKDLEPLMMELFSSSKSNSVKRQIQDEQKPGLLRDTEVKGYTGVAFRDPNDEDDIRDAWDAYDA